MTHFQTEFFQPFTYTEAQISGYFLNAEQDLTRAKHADDPNIVYRIGYDAALKLGIAMIAKAGYKVRSVPGHHIKILDQLAEILKRPDEVDYLHRIRRKRNVDLYEGGLDFTEKEAEDLLKLCETLFSEARRGKGTDS